MDANQTRLKQLQLLGSSGAGVLGAGLALLFARWLEPYAVPAVLIGIVTHGWAMFAQRSLERRADMAQPKWAIAMEWTCWGMLILLIIYVGSTLLRFSP